MHIPIYICTKQRKGDIEKVITLWNPIPCVLYEELTPCCLLFFVFHFAGVLLGCIILVSKQAGQWPKMVGEGCPTTIRALKLFGSPIVTRTTFGQGIRRILTFSLRDLTGTTIHSKWGFAERSGYGRSWTARSKSRGGIPQYIRCNRPLRRGEIDSKDDHPFQRQVDSSHLDVDREPAIMREPSNR